MKEKIGEEFQKGSRHTREGMKDWTTAIEIKPPQFKEYKEAEFISLPVPKTENNYSFTDLLVKRRSIRKFSKELMSIVELSFLLWTSTGVTSIKNERKYRTAPSAGALYPNETYLLINNVDGLEKGFYHYLIQNHALEFIIPGDHGSSLAAAALNQSMCGKANVVFLWSAIFKRSSWKYRERAYRYVYLDVGHIAQNLALAVVDLNLGCCPIAAYFDEEVDKIVQLDGKEETIIYMMVVGKI